MPISSSLQALGAAVLRIGMEWLALAWLLDAAHGFSSPPLFWYLALGALPFVTSLGALGLSVLRLQLPSLAWRSLLLIELPTLVALAHALLSLTI